MHGASSTMPHYCARSRIWFAKNLRSFYEAQLPRIACRRAAIGSEHTMQKPTNCTVDPAAAPPKNIHIPRSIRAAQCCGNVWASHCFMRAVLTTRSPPLRLLLFNDEMQAEVLRVCFMARSCTWLWPPDNHGLNNGVARRFPVAPDLLLF